MSRSSLTEVKIETRRGSGFSGPGQDLSAVCKGGAPGTPKPLSSDFHSRGPLRLLRSPVLAGVSGALAVSDLGPGRGGCLCSG